MVERLYCRLVLAIPECLECRLDEFSHFGLIPDQEGQNQLRRRTGAHIPSLRR